jgi:hypothetical protein
MLFREIIAVYVRFQGLTESSMTMTTFWDTALCSVEVYRRFRGAYCYQHQGDHLPDGGSTEFWNTGLFEQTISHKAIILNCSLV